MQHIFQKLAAVMMLAQATVSASPVLDFSLGFATSGSSLNFNNAAQISGTRARLTSGATDQAGSVWSKNQVDIRKFNCQFTFQITSPTEAGFTFAIQRAGNTVTAYSYEFLGFTPMSPSLAVKFDIWPGVSTTGIYLNGAYPNDDPPASIDMAPAGINLHSGHIFSVSLVYDGVTLQQTVTDTVTSASFTRNYTINIPTTIDGIDAFVGFTGATGGTSSIQDILTWTYSVTPLSYDVDFTAFPERLQVYPRNRTTNTATVSVAGSELMGGFSQAVLRLYRNGVQVGSDQTQNLTYVNGKAPFSFAPVIPAELAHYDVELLLRVGLNPPFSVQRSQDIVAGDVLVIQGQSNALAKTISGSASAYTSPFIRTVGIESDYPSAGPSAAGWMIAIGDGTVGQDDIGDIGQWGLVMANQVMTANGIPVAVINAGFGGQAIAFYQRNDANHSDLSTNYGRQLSRLQRAGIAGAVRTILFYQGESDQNNAASHQAGFTALRSDWLQDYPSIEKLYVFQVRESNPSGSCTTGVARFDVDLRNRQRLFADQFSNLTVMSTNGLDGHEGCHFTFTNGYESLGFNIARMLQRDLYNGPSLPNTDPPNPAYAVLTGANKNLIRIPLRNKTDAVTFNSGAIADFQVTGTAVSITSGTIVNGIIQLNLSGNATGATSIVYTGHTGPASGNWVFNGNGIGLLCFIEPLLVDTTPPVITLLGPNPVMVSQGGTYTDPGATASDNVDGNLTSSIVINTSAVNTAVPGDYPVTYNVSDVAGNAATQVTRTVHVNASASEIAVEQPTGTNLTDGASTVDFGNVVIDEDNSHTFTIRNLGGANLTGLGITVNGANASEFGITATPVAPVGPSSSTTFTVKFTPTAEGIRTAALHIASNDADENPFDIALTGTGLTNLEEWRLQHFGSLANTGPGADANDPDLDDLSNLLEFATGNDPEQSNPMPGVPTLSGNTVEFVYTRSKAAINDGFTFNVEWSDDLTSPNWNSAGVTEQILSEDSTLQQVKASVSAGSGTRRFVHLKITSP